jgi:hypothetical protein
VGKNRGTRRELEFAGLLAYLSLAELYSIRGVVLSRLASARVWVFVRPAPVVLGGAG